MRFAMSEDWYFSEHTLRSFEFETHREMTMAAIALQRFRLRHARWPEKLEDLVPEILIAVHTRRSRYDRDRAFGP